MYDDICRIKNPNRKSVVRSKPSRARTRRTLHHPLQTKYFCCTSNHAQQQKSSSLFTSFLFAIPPRISFRPAFLPSVVDICPSRDCSNPLFSNLETECHRLLQLRGGQPREITRRNRLWQDYWDQVRIGCKV